MYTNAFHTRLSQSLLLLVAVLLASCGGQNPATIAPVDVPPTSLPLATTAPLPSETPIPPPTETPEPQWTLFTDGNAVRDLAFGAGGTLWAATNGGLVAWNVADQTYTKYTTQDGLVSNIVHAISVAPDGSVWIAGQGGISHFQP